MRLYPYLFIPIVFYSLDNVVMEMHLWLLRQYTSYRTIGNLFNVNYTQVGAILKVAVRAIVDKVYVKVAGFGPDHDISHDEL